MTKLSRSVVLLSIAAVSVNAFQAPQARVKSSVRNAIALDPTNVLPSPVNDNKQDDDGEMDLTGVVLSVSFPSLFLFLSLSLSLSLSRHT